MRQAPVFVCIQGLSLENSSNRCGKWTTWSILTLSSQFAKTDARRCPHKITWCHLSVSLPLNTVDNFLQKLFHLNYLTFIFWKAIPIRGYLHQVSWHRFYVKFSAHRCKMTIYFTVGFWQAYLLRIGNPSLYTLMIEKQTLFAIPCCTVNVLKKCIIVYCFRFLSAWSLYCWATVFAQLETDSSNKFIK